MSQRIEVYRAANQDEFVQPALSQDLDLEFVIKEVKPTAFRWQRRVWLDEEWDHQKGLGYNRRVYDDEFSKVAKKIQHKTTTLGCYLKGAESEMMGWATGEHNGKLPVIYFAFTKPMYRKAGVFLELLYAFGYDPDKGFVTSSWKFGANRHSGRKYKLNAHFNPYVIYRRAYE